MNATLVLFGTRYDVFLEASWYINGTTAISARDLRGGSPVCTVSVNLPGYSELLPAGAFYGKHWSENEGVLRQLEKQGLIERVPDAPVVSCGVVSEIRAYRMKTPNNP